MVDDVDREYGDTAGDYVWIKTQDWQFPQKTQRGDWKKQSQASIEETIIVKLDLKQCRYQIKITIQVHQPFSAHHQSLQTP